MEDVGSSPTRSARFWSRSSNGESGSFLNCLDFGSTPDGITKLGLPNARAGSMPALIVETGRGAKVRFLPAFRRGPGFAVVPALPPKQSTVSGLMMVRVHPAAPVLPG